MISQRLKVKINLFQRDFFERKKRVFNNINFLIANQIRYLPLDTVLELLEYDISRKTAASFILTDGSEYVTIFRTTPFAYREGVRFRIDPILKDQGVDFISFRSINRLFNSDVALNLPKKQVTVLQPGKLFITMQGDTLRTLSELLNASIQRIRTINPNLNNPIPKGSKVVIPTKKLPPGTSAKLNKSQKRAKVKQTDMHTDIASSIIVLGRSLRGTPYQFGAPPYPRSRRFDCSSFMQYIFGRYGTRLPRNSRAQAGVGKFITLKDIEPGDLLFFRRDRYSDNRIGHVGMDIGNGNMLNTYKSPPGVTITSWRNPFWLSRHITTREIL